MSKQGLYDHNGVLLKWTNYWAGWQSRWFVLRDGILAYYNSDEEISHGCKASVNVSAVDVHVDATDTARFILSLQDGQHWYLKASTSGERQKWLIALGTAKARKSTDTSRDQIYQTMSELRLYYDALHSHVNNLKDASTEENHDVEKITEITKLLSATCDTFLSTLESCMKIAEGNFLPLHTHRRISGDTPVVLPQSDLRFSRSQSADPSFLSPKRKDGNSGLSLQRRKLHTSDTHIVASKLIQPGENSKSSTSSLEKLKLSTTVIPSSLGQQPIEYNGISGGIDAISNDSVSLKGSESLCDEQLEDTHDGKAYDTTVTEPGPEYLTFFTSMLHSFTDIEIEEDGGIPTLSFLDACDNLVPFFDKIGSTAFAPVKMDLQGNIKKIRTKMLTNPSQFCTVQNIVNIEMDMKTTKVRNSATDALLWLKRGLRFIEVFLNYLKDGKRSSATALSEAYADSLRKYHNWVVRGIFAVAARAIPSSADFYKALGSVPETSDENIPSSVLVRDIDNYVTALDVVITVLDSFYQRHDLDPDIAT